MISNKKNYFFTLMTSFGSTATSSLVGLVAVPVGLKYFNTEAYGVWTLISSVLVYLAVSNMGVNTSASVLMAKCPDVREKLLILSRSVKLLVVFSAFVLFSFGVLNYFSKDWIYALGNIPESLVRETYRTALILGAFYIINLPFSLITSVLNGFQKVYVDNFFMSISTVVNFCALLLTVVTKGDLVRLAILTGSFSLIFNVIKFGYVRIFVLNPAAEVIADSPSGRSSQTEHSYWEILRTGFRFVLISVAAMIVWNTDNFLISRILGVASVVPYSVTFKLFYIMFSVIFTVNNAALSLMGREFGNNNWAWINKIYSNLLIITVILGGAAWLFGLFFLKDIIRLWVGDTGYAGLTVVFFLGAYSYIFGMVNLNAGLINAFNYTHIMPVVGWVEAGIKFSVTYMGLRLWGIQGAAIGTFVGCLLSNTWLLPVILRKRSLGQMNINNAFLIKHFILALMPFVIFGFGVQSYATSLGVRLLCGLGSLCAYAYFSYKMAPPTVGQYVSGLLAGFRAKLARG